MQHKTLAALLALPFVQVEGISLDVTSTESIKSAASSIASGMVTYYSGNETTNIPGVLPSPYYWWEGGAFLDTLLQYWHLTGDSQYNALVSQALVFQQGPNGDFMPPNQTKSEGNDDQSTWALAAMTAAELKFPDPAGTTWISLAEAVFNDQASRWDTSTCNGGLRWQVFSFNTGYDYKNSDSNGFFFQLASRLGRYTGNSTYSDWANKAYDWSSEIGFVDEKFNVYDGTDVTTNCTSINRLQFSSYAGTYISGAAYMYNSTSGSSQWKSTLDGLLNQTISIFFPDGIATEVACESHSTCITDMYAFKGILAQQLINTIQMAPYTSSVIMPKLTTSAVGAANACSAGLSGTECGFTWGSSSAGNETGLGEQLSALSYVQGLLVGQASDVVTQSTGGSNGTVTSTGGANSSSTTTSGPAATVSKSAGTPVGIKSMSMAVMVGLVGPITWALL
ncbi:mannan endo-1,6-alpha-mannosidase [Mollisia scopiformis]|uniref:Mannan endo-1,6-alpha-mannosidase n=1 Tax=Mollisia scopiformis TaxID=149040 RepID=A0A194X831_MOLSC|nr:mannan endo-1,6-alpha-mannosidase [Mollisia scopiformis]KUJ15962.1 mannan endo-1,6-alpha-mannosidase [Mollisia scopiformis]